jgi:hypothetical protein
MSAEVSGPLSPTFTTCPCCGHWGSNFPAHCASDMCRWQVCMVCQATIGSAGAHVSGSDGAAHTRCRADGQR